MSKEKQIEEMARFMCGDCADYGTCKYGDICEGNIDVATTLYNAGYRKQSEGEWITKHTPLFKPTELVCSNCESLNGTRIKFNYCPNCGAKMKGGAE